MGKREKAQIICIGLQRVKERELLQWIGERKRGQ